MEEEFFEERNLNNRLQNKKKSYDTKMMNVTQPEDNANQ